jgi:hypothetical protein
LEVDVDLGRSIVECLLHCIFFVRAFGSVLPVDCEVEGLSGTAYARVNDDALDQLIKTKTRQFLDLQIAGRSALCFAFFSVARVYFLLSSIHLSIIYLSISLSIYLSISISLSLYLRGFLRSKL